MRKISQEELDLEKEIEREQKLYKSLPTCPCGWNGKGTGPNGRFVRGDRCPECGEWLF